MAKPKKKEELKSKQKPLVAPQEFSGATADTQMQEKVEFWKSEISQVLSQEFSSVEQAIDSIVTQVLHKMNLEDQKAEETKTFLTDLLSTDQQVLEQLRGVIKTK